MTHQFADDGDWKFADWEWDADTLTEDDLFAKIDLFMTSTGWARVTPTGCLDTDFPAIGQADLDTYGMFYLRADRATVDNWQYTGLGGVRSCGICFIRTNPAIGFREDGNPYCHTWVASEDESNIEFFNHLYSCVSMDTSLAGVHNVRLLGGTHGLLLQLSSPAGIGDAGLGAVFTYNYDPDRAPTRAAGAFGLMSQGVGSDFRREFQSISYNHGARRDYRIVLDDGSNSNKTTFIGLYAAHGCDTKLGASPTKHRLAYLLNEELGYGMFNFYAGHPHYLSSWAVMSAARDDRWRIGKMSWGILLPDTGAMWCGSYAQSSSNTIAPYGGNYTFGMQWWDPREFFTLPKVGAVSNRMAPWQVITDQATGKDYYIISVSDSGRQVCIAFEWPGPGNEIDLNGAGA